VVTDVKEGQVVTNENVRAIRPGGGCPPKLLDGMLGKRFLQNYASGTQMTPELVR
jgi:N-acetylneuraminate synthase